MSSRSRAVLRRLGYDQPEDAEAIEVNDAETEADGADPDAEVMDDRPLAGGLDPYDANGDKGPSDPRSLARQYGRRRGL